MFLSSFFSKFIVGFCLALLMFSDIASAESRSFVDKATGVSFLYPVELVKASQKYPQVIVSLGLNPQLSSSGGDGGQNVRYPTFNVTRQAGSIVALSLDALAERVLDEYRTLGLQDVELVRKFWSTFPGASERAAIIHLSFVGKLREFQALVALVPTVDDYFVLTYLDRSTTYEKFEEWRQLLFKTFSLEGRPGGKPNVPIPASNEVRGRMTEFGVVTPPSGAAERPDFGTWTDSLRNASVGGLGGGYGIIGALIALAGFFGLRKPKE